jgi:hypothetical protein
VSSQQLPCDIKHQLLREYLAALEKLKVAHSEYKEILAAGISERVASRWRQRIGAIKALASAARMRFSVHRHEHRC